MKYWIINLRNVILEVVTALLMASIRIEDLGLLRTCLLFFERGNSQVYLE